MSSSQPNNLTEVVIEPEINALVPRFVASRESEVLKIKMYLEVRNFSGVADICHTIKGIARPYGFPTLEKLSRELEASAKAGDIRNCANQLAQIEEYLKIYNRSSPVFPGTQLRS